MSGDAEQATRRANASALILVEPPTLQTVDVDIIPTVYLDIIQGTKIIQYLAQSSRYNSSAPSYIMPRQVRFLTNKFVSL